MSARVVITIVPRVRDSDEVPQFVRRNVGAPTTHACPGNGSHHSEDISLGRSGPPGEFSGAFLGAGTGRGRWRAPPEEAPRLPALGPLPPAGLVRREGKARTPPAHACRNQTFLFQ